MRLSRRGAVRASLAGLAGLAFSTAGSAGSALARSTIDGDTPATPAAALRLLREGNLRWQAGEPRHPNLHTERRSGLASAQYPHTVVLGCADSRVPPELVFDRGLGELFTVRSAGQVLDSAVAGSIAYAGRHLGPRLVVVLGHASCGAIAAALEAHSHGEVPEGPIGYLVQQLLPVVEDNAGGARDLADACVTANARIGAEQLRDLEALQEPIARGTMEVIAARYELATGAVTFLD
ncbi:carbonic anhydrase [Lipingzhangella sp. LS1_29]|uniref:carbonic anhydrase n=1 Tax=Lipingzhangella rawalii TaxID=2055835 RepID=A0ABU2HCC9_9ACTN|nr:carbonic anhydrase [Lipingzhangella rawalii]MDS1272224.1 carbonic anhydrase [Lipingzhangella rawalii]